MTAETLWLAMAAIICPRGQGVLRQDRIHANHVLAQGVRLHPRALVGRDRDGRDGVMKEDHDGYVVGGIVVVLVTIVYLALIIYGIVGMV